MRHQVVGFGLAKTFLDSTLHARQAGTELIFRQFAHGTHTTVTQVIDIVDLATAIAQLDQNLHNLDNIFVG